MGLFCEESADFRSKISRWRCDSIGFASPFGTYRSAISIVSHCDNYGIAMRNLCYRNVKKSGFLWKLNFILATIWLSKACKSTLIFRDFRPQSFLFWKNGQFSGLFVYLFLNEFFREKERWKGRKIVEFVIDKHIDGGCINTLCRQYCRMRHQAWAPTPHP